jgi:hypothetical protein
MTGALCFAQSLNLGGLEHQPIERKGKSEPIAWAQCGVTTRNLRTTAMARCPFTQDIVAPYNSYSIRFAVADYAQADHQIAPRY